MAERVGVLFRDVMYELELSEEDPFFQWLVAIEAQHLAAQQPPMAGAVMEFNEQMAGSATMGKRMADGTPVA